MTERKEVEKWINQAETTMESAREIYEDANRIQQGDPVEYREAQADLEQVNGRLEALLRVATPEQREQLNRTQQHVRQLQNQMILKQ